MPISPLDNLALFRHIPSGQTRWYPKSYMDIPELAADLVLLVPPTSVTTPNVLMNADFESGTFAPLSPSSAAAFAWNMQTDVPQSGAYFASYYNATDGTFRVMQNTDIYAPTSTDPIVITGWVRFTPTSIAPQIVGIAVGTSTASDSTVGLRVLLDYRQGTGTMSPIQIRQNTGTLASSTITRPYVQGEWLKIQAVWQSTGQLDATVSDASGAVLGTISYTQASNTSGNIGFVAYRSAGVDNLLVTQGSTTVIIGGPVPDVPKGPPLG